MKISLDWIKEFTELPEISPEELGVKFTLSTCEVEGVETINEHFEQVTVAEITGIEKHPEADKLNLVTFNSGDGEKRVVCGAPNVAVGLKVPFAPIGTTLPGGFTLTPKKIRGILSEGMLCAEDELGLGEGHEGLLVLDAEAPIGQTMADYLGMKPDILLDIDNKSITHRPDLWGHYGMAREIAAAFDKPLKRPFSPEWEEKMKALYTDETSPVTIQVEKDTACLGYCGLSVDNVTVKPSPAWMQQRLLACGMRPISNIVDISNYVMLEMGQPNHLFDRDTIQGGKIIVRDMTEDTPFTTLDETERLISKGDTMVCDVEGPSVIGGIMGGLTSSVKDSTTRIFIEAANWVDARIRHTSTRLGLRTDSSQRYEKSLDTNQLEKAILRITELLLESCPEARVVGKMESDGIIPTPELKITLDPARVNSMLGTELSAQEIAEDLEKLDFEVTEEELFLQVTVPSFRATKDIQVDADLIEEVGRVYGYDKLEAKAPLNEVEAVELAPGKKLARNISDFLVYRGRCLEIMTYPMTGEKLLETADWNTKNEKLVFANSMNPELDRMRPSLVPSLLEKTALNQKHYSNFRFFEIGRAYLPEDKEFSRENHQLGVVFFDKEKSPFMDLLNLADDLFRNLSLNAQIQPPQTRFPNPTVASDWLGRHPREFLDIKIMGKSCGFIGSIHPLINRNFKIKGHQAMLLLDMSNFMDQPIKDKTKYIPLPKFPGSTFDCTVVTPAKTPVSEVLSAAKKVRIKEMVDLKIADVYEPEDGSRNITVRASFLDREKTLTSDFLHEAENKLVAALDKAGYPLKQ